MKKLALTVTVALSLSAQAQIIIYQQQQIVSPYQGPLVNNPCGPECWAAKKYGPQYTHINQVPPEVRARVDNPGTTMISVIRPVVVPCAIRITLKDGKTIYCIWDGHHTIQVMKQQGYISFPVWYIDIDHVSDEEVEDAGFDSTDDGRIAYGAWLAGTNMRMINGKHKRTLSAYDDFMIGLETKDSQYVSMMNILRKHNCVPKRHATCAGAFTQIKSGIECYEFDKGVSWDWAIKLHRNTWPAAPMTLEVFRPLSMLHHRATIEGFNLDAKFEKELMDMLVNKWGDPESVQEGIKESYWKAYNTVGKLKGNIPEHDKERVLAGLINLYRQSGGTTMLPEPTCQWKV